MGEIIKVLGQTKIDSSDFKIELNKPHSQGEENSVHIQTETFRLEMPESEFIKVALNT
mgnify:FL=1